MAILIHCTGVGYGFMSGIEEYVVISDDEDVPVEDHAAPGFKVESVTDIGEVPTSLPIGTTLVPKD